MDILFFSRNALSIAMMQELIEAIQDGQDDTTLRTIAITAPPPIFSSGHNLKEMVTIRYPLLKKQTVRFTAGRGRGDGPNGLQTRDPTHEEHHRQSGSGNSESERNGRGSRVSASCAMRFRTLHCRQLLLNSRVNYKVRRGRL